MPGGLGNGSFSGPTGGTANAVLTGGPKYGAVDYKDLLISNIGRTTVDFDLTTSEKGMLAMLAQSVSRK
jgi:hypothetical protein